MADSTPSNSSNSFNINAYSFSLKPEYHKPSGTVNLSRMFLQVETFTVYDVENHTVSIQSLRMDPTE